MSTHNRTIETVDESRGPFSSFQIVVCCRYIYVQPGRYIHLFQKKVSDHHVEVNSEMGCNI